MDAKMHRKRFRVVKEGEKPLQIKTTNVKTPMTDALVKIPSKTRSGKKPASLSRKRKSTTEESSGKRRKQQPATLFDSEDVQIKVVDPESDLLKRVNGARCTESEIEERSAHGRLTPVKEEEDSLKIEDFDQPPQSTSTPVLLSSNKTPELANNGSPFFLSPGGYVSPVLYQPSRYVAYSQPNSQKGSPFTGRHYVEQDGLPVQFLPGNYQYAPSQPPLVGRWPPEDSYLRGYYQYLGATSELGPGYRAVYPVENMMYSPDLYPGNPMPYRHTIFPSSSNTGSYKSSGGEATYPDSNQSSKKGNVADC